MCGDMEILTKALHSGNTDIISCGLFFFLNSIAITMAFALNSFEGTIKHAKAFNNIDNLLNLMYSADHRSKV